MYIYLPKETKEGLCFCLIEKSLLFKNINSHNFTINLG